MKRTLHRPSPVWLRQMSLCAAGFLLVALPWAAAQIADPPEKSEASDPKETAEQKEEPGFMRLVEESEENAEVQTSVVEYRSKKGVQVDLIGAVHIADEEYYDDLNERFEDYDVILFEMIGGDRFTKEQLAQAGAGTSGISSVQSWMSKSLDLEFQLKGIDYSAENFVHADMSVEEFAKAQKENNETMLRLMMQAASDPDLNAAASKNQPGLADLLRILASPDMASEMKFLFAQQIAMQEEALAKFGEDTVILAGRNEVVLKKLDEMVAKGHRKIGVFYGAGHMLGLEKPLLEDKGYEKGKTSWLTAWKIERAPLPGTKKKEGSEAAPASAK